MLSERKKAVRTDHTLYDSIYIKCLKQAHCRDNINQWLPWVREGWGELKGGVTAKVQGISFSWDDEMFKK